MEKTKTKDPVIEGFNIPTNEEIPKLVVGFTGMYTKVKLNAHNLPMVHKAFIDIWDQSTIDKQEKLYMMLFDKQDNVIGYHMIAEGSSTAVRLNVKRFCAICLQSGASGVIIAHNHPKQVALQPSQGDYDSANILDTALNLIGLRLIDSMIIGKHSYFSLRTHLPKSNPEEQVLKRECFKVYLDRIHLEKIEAVKRINPINTVSII